jgi:hypothetical protein
MLSTTAIPEYLSLAKNETGASLNISCECYRYLARTALAITKGADRLMAIYKLPNQGGCCLDIFLQGCCLSICIDSQGKALHLLTSDLDSGDLPICLLSSDDSEQSWRRLKDLALLMK